MGVACGPRSKEGRNNSTLRGLQEDQQGHQDGPISYA